MKRIIIVIAALSSLVASVPAEAGPCGNKPCTTEQINRALQWLGRPEHEQIGRARVLHDDNAGTTTSHSTSTQIIKYR